MHHVTAHGKSTQIITVFSIFSLIKLYCKPQPTLHNEPLAKDERPSEDFGALNLQAPGDEESGLRS